MDREITIGSTKQLIDLNQDLVNFDLTVKVATVNPTDEFQGVIVTQNDLDNDDELSYRNFKGSMQARVTADKGVYQNHFLVLRSSKPVNSRLKVEYGPVPKTRTPPPPPMPLTESPPDNIKITTQKTKTYFTTWNALIILGVILLGVFLYYTWTKKSTISGSFSLENKPLNTNGSNVAEAISSIAAAACDILDAKPKQAPSLPPIATVTSVSENPSIALNHQFLQKLNNIITTD